ncbi:MAG: ATP-grasp domain-containing protein [Balneolaceae bacterium]
MKPIDVAILTESRYVNPSDDSQYVLNVLWEDNLLKSALEKLGLNVVRIDWADPDFDWNSTRCAVFRTTWDYFDRFPEFDAWLSRVKDQTMFINPIDQVRWNMNKTYLRDLKENGVKVVDTKFIEHRDARTLREIFLDMGCEDAVLKPLIAGAARHTYLINHDNIDDHEEVYHTLIYNEGMMLQPYQYSITTKGEISLMVIGGEFTHAILKKAKPGDFRVQDDFGGTVHSYEPGYLEMEFAEKVVRACDPIPAYARVDVMWDNSGDFVLSELELIEPELWFRENIASAEKLARVIKKKIDESSVFY